MKVLGIIFSLLGNILTFLVFIVTTIIMAISALSDDYNLTLFIVLSVVTIVFYILATIGNKIQDSLKDGLKLKVVLFRILGRLAAFIAIVLAIAGAFVIVAGLAMDFGVDLEVISCEPIILYFLGAYLLVAGVLNNTLYDRYILTHCKYCGSNLVGADYEYEEIERSSSYNSQNDSVTFKSRIKFIFDCPVCEKENIVYKTLQTDEEVVDKFARSVVGKE